MKRREKGMDAGGREADREKERDGGVYVHLPRRERKREAYSAKLLRGTYLANEA